jgi:anti-sigma B factor antagonist
MRPVDESNLGSPDLTGTPADIRIHRDGDAVIIIVSGEIDLSTASRLESAIRDAEETDIGRIVLDMSDLSFLDSSALNVLLQASLRNREDGNRLSFVPSRHDAVKRLVALTGTAKYLE